MDRAGIPQDYSETCGGQTSTTGAPATGVCYLDNVIGPGSPRFDDAYWEIAHIRAYTTGTNGPPGPTSAPNNVVQVPASAARRALDVSASSLLLLLALAVFML